LSRNEVKDVVAGTTDREEVVRAMNLTLQRKPEDPAAYFRQAIRKKAGVAAVVDDTPPIVVQDAGSDGSDPFETI